MSALDLAAGQLADAELAAGPAVNVRRATARDRTELAAMFARCTPQTRYRRFHGPVAAFPERYLAEALAGDPVHFALVAVADGGRVAALASCRTTASGTAELGVLVADPWQRLGIGGILLDEIISHAKRTGLTALTAQILAEQSWIIRLLRRYGACETARVREVLDVTLRLEAGG